jgi:septal ring factor EnvC (AmiA/AmiB activator)
MDMSNMDKDNKNSKTILDKVLEKGINSIYLTMIECMQEENDKREKQNQEYKSKLDETNQKLEESNKKIEELERVINEMKSEFKEQFANIDYDIDYLYTHR